MADDRFQQAREQRAGLRTAIGRVERSLSSAAGGRADAWAKELRDEMDGLSRALEQHIEITESPEGLLADIATAAPRLVKRVARARDDHASLRGKVLDARASLTGLEDDIARGRDQVVELLTALVRHRHLGADLVYEAYNVDIEASD